MGQTQSSLPPDEVARLCEQTSFSRKQLLRLHARFSRLDKFDVGYLSTQDFLSIPEIAVNPLGLGLIALFDVKRNDQVRCLRWRRCAVVRARRTASLATPTAESAC